MKRDFELIRQILLQVEANEELTEWFDPEVEGYSEQGVSYHVMILSQAGLIEGLNRTAIGIFRWSARNLTWQGHEFIEAARDEARWRAALADSRARGALCLPILHEHMLDALRAAKI